MIAPLRRRHRQIFTTLAVALPLGLLASLANRAPEPTLEALPSELEAGGPTTGSEPDHESRDTFTQPLTLRQWTASDGMIVALEPHAPLTAPDLLLYLAGSDVEAGGALPADARLLGPVPGHGERRYIVPPGQGGGSQLVLYSLAWQKVVDAAETPTVSGAADRAAEKQDREIGEVG